MSDGTPGKAIDALSLVDRAVARPAGLRQRAGANVPCAGARAAAGRLDRHPGFPRETTPSAKEAA